jgi:hypothetical protein
VRAPDTRAGAKKADARLAELIIAVEEGRAPSVRAPRSANVLTMDELAERWMRANRPRQNSRTGQWIGWSPKTAKTHRVNFRTYILPKLVAANPALSADPGKTKAQQTVGPVDQV